MFRIDRTQVHLENVQTLQANAQGLGRAEGAPEAESAAIVQEKEPPSSARAAEVAKINDEQIRRLTQMADDIVKQATIEANLAVQTAELDALEIRSRAWQDGYMEGKEAVEEELRRLRREDAQRVEKALSALAHTREELIDRFEDDILELCFAMVKKVINTAIKKDDTIFESMMKRALQQMKWEGDITIRVSGEEYRNLFSSGSATFVVGDKSVTAAIVDDPSVGEGGCIVESQGETINAGVDSQLMYLERAFQHPEGAQA